jgi:hypothetical protein
MPVTLLLFATCFILASSALGLPQFEKAVWKQRVLLLQSTRADVEKAFGKPIGENYGVTYKLKDGILYLDYYDFDHCKSQDGFQADWNVPEWTVTEIEFMPKRKTTVASLDLNLKHLRMAHLNPETPQLLSYIDDKEGIEYTVNESSHTLNSVRYFPGSLHSALRCPATLKK